MNGVDMDRRGAAFTIVTMAVVAGLVVAILVTHGDSRPAAALCGVAVMYLAHQAIYRLWRRR